jgi:peptidoglycan/LPS O-acetylase OafA/YrhL
VPARPPKHQENKALRQPTAAILRTSTSSNDPVRGVQAASSQSVRALGQRPALDGVRAIAIVAVMGFHAHIGQFRGGYFGVDIFFVLSGFLITSLLVAERETAGRIDFRAFYVRRALRLLPALVLMVTAMLALTAVKPHWPEVQHVQRDALATLGYSANWLYVGLDKFPLNVFSHTWSLSIEEQFYLLWPLLLTLGILLSRGRRPLVLATILAGFVASNALRWWLYHRGIPGPRLALATDTRAGALLIGCAAGLVVTWDMLPRSALGRLVVRVGGVVGTGVLVWMVLGSRYAMVDITPGRVYGEGYTLIALVSALLILWLVAEPRSPLARLLSVGPVVWIGAVSYGLYLWHFPIDILVTHERFEAPDFVRQAVRLLLILGIVTLSYYLLERPFLRLKRRFERRPDRNTGTVRSETYLPPVPVAARGAPQNPGGGSGP